MPQSVDIGRSSQQAVHGRAQALQGCGVEHKHHKALDLTKPIAFTLPTSGWAFTDIGGTGVSGRVGVAVPLPNRRAGAITRSPAESRHLADFLPAGQGPMPIGVCAADLAESNDPRERRAGARNPYRTHHGIQQGNEQ